ncbi:Panacea domain-containing protein [Corynebacterium freneyi]
MHQYTGLDIAKWFVAWGEEQDADDVSNLKLQKLLYYAQGHYFAQYGRRLFSDDLSAWQHGPVSEDVYHKLKCYGKRPVDPDQFLADFDWDDYRDVEQFLIHVWDRYAPFTAWALRNRSHREAPWVNTDRGCKIDDVELKEFFGSMDASLG